MMDREEIIERLRLSATAIREHVPDDDGSFAAVATSSAHPQRKMVAGVLHVDLLEQAADALSVQGEEIRRAGQIDSCGLSSSMFTTSSLDAIISKTYSRPTAAVSSNTVAP